MLKTSLLFFATALCEIVGCYLPWLWLKRGATPLLLVPAGLALAMFVWLLTLHPAASGRVYAAYGGVYIFTALLWLRVVEGEKLTAYDWLGAASRAMWHADHCCRLGAELNPPSVSCVISQSFVRFKTPRFVILLGIF
ncbi:Uncharacterised BCR, YnfA/UPF0060 family [Kluyvera cryocrescens]|uniref:Uncharacterized BCR, YnfA/UPF0060 family n=1 Tax=Kluyvera cryocrescens TaxID=580 RepID=A0A485CR37_KLUCR|nr:Uncharacterised BCR, YnfA/UPF0060 family [Kluyvera cryocrescens]